LLRLLCPPIHSELVIRVAAQNPHLYQRDVEAVVDTILDCITEARAAGDRVELRNFGSFAIKQREARQGRNPRTGTKVDVPAKADVRFKPAKSILAALNPKAGPLAMAAE